MIRIMSLVFFCCIGGTGFGQFLMKAGHTSADVTFPETEKFKISPVGGSVFGMGYDIGNDSSRFSFLIETLIIKKGAKDVKDTNGGVGNRRRVTTNTVNITYFEVPFLAKYTIGKNNIQFFLNTGFSLAVAMSGKFTSEVALQDPYPDGPWTTQSISGKVVFQEDDPKADELNVDNNTDIVFNLGGGLLLFKRVILDFRYGLGLKNLYNTGEFYPRNPPSSKNRVMQFSLGYNFGS